MIPRSHPRYKSLVAREKLVSGYKDGIVVLEGLIAQGRGEAFDYLLGERTTRFAKEAIKVASAYLLLSQRPVISVNGNAAMLAGKELVELANEIPAKLEVNLFHYTKERVKKITELLSSLGARQVLGLGATQCIPNLESSRSLCCPNGIYQADTVLLAIEDGDRTEALVGMGKNVLAIDLNPLSRTAQTATVTIVDDVKRALVELKKESKLAVEKRKKMKKIIDAWDNKKNLKAVLRYVVERLNAI